MQNIDLSTKSLVDLLNLIKSNVEEDRKFALENYQLIFSLIKKRIEESNDPDLVRLLTEMDIGAPDLTQSLEKFLSVSSESSDKLIKIAKMVMEYTIFENKIKKEDDTLSDEEKNRLLESLNNLVDLKSQTPTVSLGELDGEEKADGVD